MNKPIISYIAEISSLSPKDRPFVLLEIGACDGFHSQLMASTLIMTAPSGSFTMHSFEPVKTLRPSWEGWCVNIRKHIQFFDYAIGRTDGSVDFFVSSGKDYYGSSSLRAPKFVLDGFPEMKFTGTEIESKRLDTHCKQTGLNYIDFIWMDVQGAERDVFDGGIDILKHTRYIYTEYVNGEHYEGQYTLNELLKQLGPNWVVVEDYGGDVLLKNTAFM